METITLIADRDAKSPVAEAYPVLQRWSGAENDHRYQRYAKRR